MKIRIISNREEIPTLHANEKIVHLSFRPANLDFFAVVEACPKIEAIEIPKSYLYSISESSRVFLEMMNIELIEGEVWGHRVDIKKHYEVPEYISDKVRELIKNGKSNQEIIEEVAKKYRVSGQLASYIVRNEPAA
jgi:hypothetical protein